MIARGCPRRSVQVTLYHIFIYMTDDPITLVFTQKYLIDQINLFLHPIEAIPLRSTCHLMRKYIPPPQKLKHLERQRLVYYACHNDWVNLACILFDHGYYLYGMDNLATRCLHRGLYDRVRSRANTVSTAQKRTLTEEDKFFRCREIGDFEACLQYYATLPTGSLWIPDDLMNFTASSNPLVRNLAITRGITLFTEMVDIAIRESSPDFFPTMGKSAFNAILIKATENGRTDVCNLMRSYGADDFPNH